MANLAYINIIQNAPTPLIIIFGMAHAAMTWVIYIYAKDMFREAVRWMAEREVASRHLVEKSEIDISNDHPKLRMDAISGFIYDKPGTEKNRLMRGAEKVARSSYTMHITRATIFFGCWGIIASIRYFYAGTPYCESISQNLVNSLHNSTGLCQRYDNFLVMIDFIITQSTPFPLL